MATLKDIQTKLPSLAIYEVVVGEEVYKWRNTARNLPWLSVLDAEGEHAQTYNVQALPTFYLIEGGKLQRLRNPLEVLR